MQAVLLLLRSLGICLWDRAASCGHNGCFFSAQQASIERFLCVPCLSAKNLWDITLPAKSSAWVQNSTSGGNMVIYSQDQNKWPEVWKPEGNHRKDGPEPTMETKCGWVGVWGQGVKGIPGRRRALVKSPKRTRWQRDEKWPAHSTAGSHDYLLALGASGINRRRRFWGGLAWPWVSVPSHCQAQLDL